MLLIKKTDLSLQWLYDLNKQVLLNANKKYETLSD